MREIKFRVWDTKLNKFIPWNPFIRFNDPEYIVQQFTGLCGKNNQEIYEGDIVKNDPDHIGYTLRGNTEDYTNGTITWLREGFSVCQYYMGATEMHEFTMCHCCPCGLEVIGNIFETPELVSKLKDDD